MHGMDACPHAQSAHLLFRQAMPLLEHLVQRPVRRAGVVPQLALRVEELWGTAARGHQAARHVAQQLHHLPGGAAGRAGRGRVNG